MVSLVCLIFACSADPQLGVGAGFEARAATIRIHCKDTGSVGSGIIVGKKDGFYYALTANHVVRQSKTIECFSRSLGSTPRTHAFSDLEVLWGDPEPDLACVRFPVMGVDIDPLAISAISPELKRFPKAVFSVGWHESEAPTVAADESLARKLLRNKEGGTAFFWQTRIPPIEGRSGGALIDQKGRLIGICSGSQEGKGYYTHLDEIHYGLRRNSSSKWLWPGNSK
ncbi:MAG: serine protease [Planctomycetes bacterium]|nr:serine protease [Planctomycetota bacterium]